MKFSTPVMVLLMCLVAGSASAAEFEARLDRDRVALGETVELQIRLQDRDWTPDIAPLNSDFAVIDVRRGSRLRIVNGRRESSVDWQLTLAPLRVGSLEIPALRAGDAESEPIALEVLEAGALAAAEPADPSAGQRQSDAAAPAVLVETEVDDESPYVQGKIGLTVRVLMDERIVSGSLSEPTADDAVVRRTGEDLRYEESRNGRTYQVVERQYAIFPQRSGQLVIPPILFDGRARSERRSTRRIDRFASMFGDSFFNGLAGDVPGFGDSLLDEMLGGRGTAVQTASTALSVAVKPKPDAAGTGWWLPARDVELVEQWEDAQPAFRVGEPVTRSIAIRATGVSGAQLPTLDLPDIEGMKQYGEPAVDETATVGDEVVSIKLQKAALVPTEPGPATLPAIELSWWDTENDEARTAVLPARTVDVLPAAGHAATPPPLPASAGPAENDTIQAAAGASGAGGFDARVLWVSMSALVLALACGLVWARHRTRGAKLPDPTSGGSSARTPEVSQRESEARLREACKRGDAGAALAALGEIARSRWPVAPPSGGVGWGVRTGSPVLEEAIAGAERARYAPGATGWDGRSLWQAYRATAKGRSARHSAPNVLPDLYPAPHAKSR